LLIGGHIFQAWGSYQEGRRSQLKAKGLPGYEGRGVIIAKARPVIRGMLSGEIGYRDFLKIKINNTVKLLRICIVEGRHRYWLGPLK